jgi:hypothetical protein
MGETLKRRNFLKVFGLSTAALVSENGDAVTVIDSNVKPIENSGAYNYLWQDRYDVTPGCLYDHVRVERHTGPHRIQFFSDVEASSKKCYNDTNLVRNQQLEPTCMFAIKKLGITFGPQTSEAIRDAVVKRYALELWLSQKNYFRAPLIECNTSEVFSSKGPRSVKALYALDIPIILSHHHSFYAHLVGQGLSYSNPAFDLWCVFHGLWARGVQ